MKYLYVARLWVFGRQSADWKCACWSMAKCHEDTLACGTGIAITPTRSTMACSIHQVLTDLLHTFWVLVVSELGVTAAKGNAFPLLTPCQPWTCYCVWLWLDRFESFENPYKACRLGPLACWMQPLCYNTILYRTYTIGVLCRSPHLFVHSKICVWVYYSVCSPSEYCRFGVRNMLVCVVC